MEETVKENKMGVMPVKKLIITMSLPMMMSMLVQALYNIVDSVFVSRINEEALTAVTLAFPLQSLIFSVGAGTGVGINALLSKALGEKDHERANKSANMGIFLTFVNYVVFMLLGVFAASPFINSQTDNALIAEYGVTYLRLVCVLGVGGMFQMTFERLLQSTGKTFYSMISQMTGAIINMIFDPILIFGYFGFPALGVAGAAYATVFGQVTAALLGLFMNKKFNTDIQLSFKSILKPDLSIIKRIYQVGIPSVLMMSIGSIMTYSMNRILIGFSTTATAVFGVYFKLQSFFFMPIFGLNNGLVPVLAYNYGAKRRKRIDEALRTAAAASFSIMTIGMIIFLLFPRQLLELFNASDRMIALGTPALRTICLSFPVAGIAIIMSSVFQAFSESIYSLLISLGRQLVVLIPAAWLLSRLGNVNYVWFAFPIAEAMSFILSVVFFSRVYRRRVVPLED